MLHFMSRAWLTLLGNVILRDGHQDGVLYFGILAKWCWGHCPRRNLFHVGASCSNVAVDSPRDYT